MADKIEKPKVLFAPEIVEQYPYFQEVYERKLDISDVEWRATTGEKDEDGSKTGKDMYACYITARTLYRFCMEAFGGKATHSYIVDEKTNACKATISYPLVLKNGTTHIVSVEDHVQWEGSSDMKKKGSVSNAFKRCGPHLFKGCMWLYEMPKVYLTSENWEKGKKLYTNAETMLCFNKISELIQIGTLTGDDQLIIVQKKDYTTALYYHEFQKAGGIIWEAPKSKKKRYEDPKGQEQKKVEPEREETPKEEQLVLKCTISVGANKLEANYIDCRSYPQSKVGKDAVIEYVKGKKDAKRILVSNGTLATYNMNGTVYLFDATDDRTLGTLTTSFKFETIVGDIALQ